MRISTFLNSYAGMYVVQAFCHSLVAAIIADRAQRAWNITDPVVQQRFSFIVVLLPIISFPIYEALNPSRSTVPFRLDALFDSHRWLDMELWGTIPLNILFLLVLLVTTMVFLFQEMIPVLRHTLESHDHPRQQAADTAHPFLERAGRVLMIETPEVAIIDDDELFIFTATGKEPVIMVSSGLASALTPDQMQAALAHELAHISRNRRPVLLTIFFIRMLMFFNPVVLLEFRRMVRNEEKICDDIAVSLTGDSLVLAETLKMFYVTAQPHETEAGLKPHKSPVHLEEYSHNLQLSDRITRLEQNDFRLNSGWRIPFISTCVITMVINYFIV